MIYRSFTILLLLVLASCEKEYLVLDAPNGKLILRKINSSTHRLVSTYQTRQDQPTAFSERVFEYDEAGRCITFGSKTRDTEYAYYSHYISSFTWENEWIIAEHVDGIDPFAPVYTDDYYMTQIKQGNRIVRRTFLSSNNRLLSTFIWIEGEPTYQKKVRYLGGGSSDSIVTFYEKVEEGKYKRFNVNDGDTLLVQTEQYDEKGRVILEAKPNRNIYTHYFDSLKNPYPRLNMDPGQVERPLFTGLESFSIKLDDNAERVPLIYSNGDLPQIMVTGQGDSLFFRYELRE